MMFTNWLETTRELQIKSFGADPASLEGEELVEFIRWNQLATVDELMEALHECRWKPWSTGDRGFINRDAFVGELVDACHFIGNLLAAARCDDAEFSERYEAKQQTNRDRMASGTYDQVKDKCAGCGRAFDDDATACTATSCVDQMTPPLHETVIDEWEDAGLGTNVHVNDSVRVRDDAYTGPRGDDFNGKVFTVVSVNHGYVELGLDKSYTLHHPDKLQARKSSRR